jgi:hypothetical protein
MRTIAASAGVPVVGGTEEDHPPIAYNAGVYVKCSPSGGCESGVGRPQPQ